MDNENLNNHDSYDTPIVIEEEPVHEFYARLCNTKVTKRIVSTKTRTSPRINSAIIPIDTDLDNVSGPLHHKSDPTKAPNAFSKAFQYALSSPSFSSSLSLNSSNCQKGFKLLEKMGWNEKDGGLGKNRQGIICPISTKWNRYQRGLGSGKRPLESRITHRPPKKKIKQHNNEMTKLTKGQRKRLRIEKEEQQRQREKQTRLMLRSDISEEFECLYATHCS